MLGRCLGVLGGILTPSSISQCQDLYPLDESCPNYKNTVAANEDSFDPPPDCGTFRTYLNGMYQQIQRLERIASTDPRVLWDWKTRFDRFLRAFEKQCGPFTPPPSIEDVYTK
jgi:hypothetical protein